MLDECLMSRLLAEILHCKYGERMERTGSTFWCGCCGKRKIEARPDFGGNSGGGGNKFRGGAVV